MQLTRTVPLASMPTWKEVEFAKRRLMPLLDERTKSVCIEGVSASRFFGTRNLVFMVSFQSERKLVVKRYSDPSFKRGEAFALRTLSGIAVPRILLETGDALMKTYVEGRTGRDIAFNRKLGMELAHQFGQVQMQLKKSITFELAAMNYEKSLEKSFLKMLEMHGFGNEMRSEFSLAIGNVSEALRKRPDAPYVDMDLSNVVLDERGILHLIDVEVNRSAADVYAIAKLAGLDGATMSGVLPEELLESWRSGFWNEFNRHKNGDDELLQAFRNATFLRALNSVAMTVKKTRELEDDRLLDENERWRGIEGFRNKLSQRLERALEVVKMLHPKLSSLMSDIDGKLRKIYSA